MPKKDPSDEKIVLGVAFDNLGICNAGKGLCVSKARYKDKTYNQAYFDFVRGVVYFTDSDSTQFSMRARDSHLKTNKTFLEKYCTRIPISLQQ